MFSMLTLVFGAVIAVLLSALLILIFTRQSERKDLREQQRDASHSLQYFYTTITPGLHFPEFTVVGLVDGEQFVYYDSNIRKKIPKTEWMEKNEGEDYWKTETETSQHHQEAFRYDVTSLMKRFNQTGGFHTLQQMYGCELDADGDFNRGQWRRWEREDLAPHVKYYLQNQCTEWLKIYVNYSRSSLERKVPPEASLFQKDSSSPVVCHTTGFFPKAVMISWQKNGEDLHENVELRETLPNQDGTFQKRSVLTVSPEELNRNQYSCVVQHGGLEKEVQVLLALGHTASHSLRYISTAITPGTLFPQYTVVGLVDGEPLMVCDGNTRKMTPKTERMEKNEGEEFWNSESQIFKDEQRWSLSNMDTTMKRHNNTEGEDALLCDASLKIMLGEAKHTKI
ncbi:hypothetical protein AOLI_G00274820 [Acnodon oligacanthus]